MLTVHLQPAHEKKNIYDPRGYPEGLLKKTYIRLFLAIFFLDIRFFRATHPPIGRTGQDSGNPHRKYTFFLIAPPNIRFFKDWPAKKKKKNKGELGAPQVRPKVKGNKNEENWRAAGAPQSKKGGNGARRKKSGFYYVS